MKLQTIFTAAILLFCVTIATAGSDYRNLTFYDIDGHPLTMPMMEEEPAEPTPFDTVAAIDSEPTGSTYHILDIDRFSKPEEEEPLPFDLDSVLKAQQINPAK
ncbi:MAG: hypothetical protein R6U62_06480 [Bacteroidales bacterium]